MGQTVVDWCGITEGPGNVHFVREVAAEAFFELLTERIGRL
jgi:purine nucleosidase